MLKFAASFAVAGLLLTGCSQGTDSSASGAAEIVTADIAVQTHMQSMYGGRVLDCYAPRDWNTDRWAEVSSGPGAPGPEADCTRVAIIDAAPEADGNWCVRAASQDTYKWADAEGFSIGTINVTKYCYQFDISDGAIVGTHYLGGQPAGALAAWPV